MYTSLHDHSRGRFSAALKKARARAGKKQRAILILADTPVCVAYRTDPDDLPVVPLDLSKERGYRLMFPLIKKTYLQEIDMSYEDRDTYGMYKSYGKGPGPRLMGADTLIGEDVYSHKDEDLGDIKEIMLDMNSGKVAYAVLEFGGVMGMGSKLFAVPWNALKLDTENKRFILNVDKERLESAPGFDKDDWPDMADPAWQNTIQSYYGTRSYTEPYGESGKQPEDTPDTPYEETPYTKPQTGNYDSRRTS